MLFYSIHKIATQRRHSHASYLINLGCAPLLISERLGHEKIQTTLSTYSHLYPNKHQEVVDMMQNQHRLDETVNATDTPAAAANNEKPTATRFKVVSPKNTTSPKQAHEKQGALDKKTQPLANKGLSQYFELCLITRCL